MRQQSYLLRKGARYHFRRRTSHLPGKRPITMALGTADPAEAKRLSRQLAVKWDELTMWLERQIERGTLTLDEQDALFRKGLADELARATAHLTAPMGTTMPHPEHHKIMAAAYRIVARVPHDSDAISAGVFEAEIDENWSDDEVSLLKNTLRWLVTPMSVNRTSAKEAAAQIGAPLTEGVITEARSHILRGFAEAHERTAMAVNSGYDIGRLGGSGLLGDDWKGFVPSAKDQAPRPDPKPVRAVPPEEEGNLFFARTTEVRFSEQIAELLDKMFEDNGWQPDNNKTRHMLEAFAWLTGDKMMSDYEPADIDEYVRRMARIPKGFNWGRLNKSGAMAVPFDPAEFPKPKAADRRSDRTINSHLSKLEAAAAILKKTHWLPRQGYGQVMVFEEARKRIVQDDNDPPRLPLTEANLVALYGLPLWQGGGGSGARVKPSQSPTIYQDGAYWVPLLGTYAGMSREEACGLELIDIEIEAETPYILVQANMTKSKDGETPAGIKRASRRRALPIHPQLLRLGFAAYVSAIAKEGWDMLFPELYGEIDESGDYVRWKKPGGPKFYGTAWRYMIDAAHAVVPLPMTSAGKHADFHSQRTFHYSAMAGEGVSEALLARHVGHSARTTGGRNYNRRALALGEEKELAERLTVLVREVPNVTAHIPKPDRVNLLHLSKRSRVGSAPGRNAANRFLA
ncbi:DUF6538 domain-containing protein [Novosphingopyxis sp. YJ-S2-01]|uniref:DUF6538 domain-containing protein n=1 Tax=Novosphingopyxis sp. YJ-S2-01 TaxID=2794021 RepID=UPI0018DDB9FD|nr:DUF6538 domain-containing protein [Novosphingopyxis sp. YJ-S2-01]MBH9537052.1 hypothetical protein [Novosphingopyxis sp. YJ-S2-01]